MMKQRRFLWFPILALMLGAAFVIYRLIVPVRLDIDQAYQGTELSGTAPDFSLADQNGTLVRLSNFRGKIVVLTFMDSQCKDVCPLTSAQLIETYKQLHPDEASQVVFLGVNVNLEANSTADVSKATQEWHLTEIPDWHFMTGDQDQLEAVWRAYAIAVISESDSITHTSGVYLIDSSGQKRWYVSVPSLEAGSPQQIMPLNELLTLHIRELLSEK